jgi:hypothetical protein
MMHNYEFKVDVDLTQAVQSQPFVHFPRAAPHRAPHAVPVIAESDSSLAPRALYQQVAEKLRE